MSINVQIMTIISYKTRKYTSRRLLCLKKNRLSISLLFSVSVGFTVIARSKTSPVGIIGAICTWLIINFLQDSFF